MSQSRVRLLCEDRRAERFFRRLCEQAGVRVVGVEVAPDGQGSAADWVLSRYPALVRQRRAKAFQANLGLLVHIDGDAVGVTQRKTELDARLAAHSMEARQAAEPVAVCVPTWCIETWVLHLAELGTPAESVRVNRTPVGATP
ncbi:MAG: hypothetical protein JNJ54_09355 [Myxococcaceae bacterium]|nr:hypothetical protein [Myxococcaceae bacterium]